MLAKLGGKKKARAAMPVAKSAPGAALAMGVVEGRAADTRVLIRGELDQPGESVSRGFVQVLTSGPAPSISPVQSGRRELADWLVTNPLTARVMVNRVWASLFGQGLVRTADNFGANGEKPSHPELLDALAVAFSSPQAISASQPSIVPTKTHRGLLADSNLNSQLALGWSVKQLIRSIILSRTYQLSSAHDSAAVESDPDNRLLWRATPRRLDAEAIRDAMLAASGQLDLTPAQGSFVATIGDGYIGKSIRPEVFASHTSTKRSAYLPIVRDFVPEALELFDFAEPSLVVAARDVTNVPSQALFLMNNAFVREQSAAFARRILATPLDYPQRIRLAYQLALSRPPTAAEVARANTYLLTEARGLIAAKPADKDAAPEHSWSTFCQALFACAEFRYLQ